MKTCFEQLHLERVILQIAVNNQKSRRVAKRMGMRLECSMEDKWKTLWGLEDFSETYACDLQFSISYSEWRAQMTELD
jgi:RimJ/RimL family protein N-acetyltransferase